MTTTTNPDLITIAVEELEGGDTIRNSAGERLHVIDVEPDTLPDDADLKVTYCRAGEPSPIWTTYASPDAAVRVER